MTVRVRLWLIRIALAVFLIQVVSPAIAMVSPIGDRADMSRAKLHAVSDNRIQTAIQRANDGAIAKHQCVNHSHSVRGGPATMLKHDNATHFEMCKTCLVSCGGAAGLHEPTVAPVAIETNTLNHVDTTLSAGVVTRVLLRPPRAWADC